MRIFVVEDSTLLRERLLQTLSTIHGLQLSGQSDTADEAISQIRLTQPDAVILDIRLKQGNGLQVLQAIKARGQPPVVIVLTNFAYTQYRTKFLEAGADYFFDKSNDFDQVPVILRQLMKKKKSIPTNQDWDKPANERLDL